MNDVNNTSDTNNMNNMNNTNDKTRLLPEFSCPEDLADTYIFIILQKINYL